MMVVLRFNRNQPTVFGFYSLNATIWNFRHSLVDVSVGMICVYLPNFLRDAPYPFCFASRRIPQVNAPDEARITIIDQQHEERALAVDVAPVLRLPASLWTQSVISAALETRVFTVPWEYQHHLSGPRVDGTWSWYVMRKFNDAISPGFPPAAGWAWKALTFNPGVNTSAGDYRASCDDEAWLRINSGPACYTPVKKDGDITVHYSSSTDSLQSTRKGTKKERGVILRTRDNKDWLEFANTYSLSSGNAASSQLRNEVKRLGPSLDISATDFVV
ncbi:uncharacterized protein EV420DRAFT_1473256 [Desarmillaria tabescens]|uniref:Uncharacterized protein n=1 Tax=Armillaria tabescens TaxID=1929756 RepID=A0AA39T7P3_ARMTA|nr:uncharacterized protein EV420DRAFT_1473256 [Desarmillaria tabescens]KAK0470171.1 hypothetical protein EV420DRAFT_1473256 [Desarmillaria tabescens]